MLKPAKICLIILMVFSCGLANAVNGMFVSVGAGMSDLLIQSSSTTGASQISAGLSWQTDSHFEHAILGYSELSFEAYASQLNHHEKINLLAFRPVLTFWGDPQKSRNWYWQAGLGVAYLDSKNFAPIRLSTNGQFVTMFGLGMPLDNAAQHSLTLRYNHYSNGYIKSPNPGIDMLSLDWHLTF